MTTPTQWPELHPRRQDGHLPSSLALTATTKASSGATWSISLPLHAPTAGALTLAEGEPLMMQVSTLTTWTAMASVSWSSTLGWGGAVRRGRNQGVAPGTTLQLKGHKARHRCPEAGK